MQDKDIALGIILTLLILATALFFGYKAFSDAGLDFGVVKQAQAASKNNSYKGFAPYRIIKDQEYGCEYIIDSFRESGIHPRLNAAGEHVGCTSKTNSNSE